MNIRKILIYSFISFLIFDLTNEANSRTKYFSVKNNKIDKNNPKFRHNFFNKRNINLTKKKDEFNTFPIVNPNLINIKGPKISIVLKKTSAKKAFEYLANLGNYGYVWVQNDPTDDVEKKSRGVDSDRLIIRFQRELK